MEELKPYLIQRGKFEERDWKKGIDSILSFDYMGSAEFEFGALGSSLKSIRENIKDYRYHPLKINEKPVTIFVHKKYSITDLVKYLNSLSKREKRLMEYSDFDTYINPSDHEFSSKNRTDFWWDIDYDIMFWKTDDEFENKFKNLIG